MENSQTNTRVLVPLVYNGEVIHQRDEMLSLMDMWKAAGSDPSKEPKFWRRQDGAQAFIDAVALAENVTQDHLFSVKQGRGGGTWAHWQVGLAYAKYLSPEFHMFCNTVVRERMEGITYGSAATPLRPSSVPARVALSDFKAYAALGRFIGLDRNQSLLSANQATRRKFGVDLLADIQHTHLVAPQQEKVLTASDIAAELGLKSAIAANAFLSDCGLQVGKRDAKDRGYWVPTEKGEAYAVWLDTSKKHGDGTPVQQLKWSASMLDAVRDRLAVTSVAPIFKVT